MYQLAGCLLLLCTSTLSIEALFWGVQEQLVSLQNSLPSSAVCGMFFCLLCVCCQLFACSNGAAFACRRSRLRKR